MNFVFGDKEYLSDNLFRPFGGEFGISSYKIPFEAKDDDTLTKTNSAYIKHINQKHERTSKQEVKQ